MPPTRGEPTRWKSSETIGILSYLNDNFDTWHTNHLSACVRAVEATNIDRDPRAVYNKIYKMIDSMESFLETGEKSTVYNNILENNQIHNLVKRICNKAKGKKKREKSPRTSNRTNDNDVEMTGETSTIRNGHVPQQMLFSTEVVTNLYNEKIERNNQIKIKLIKTIENVNSTFEKSNIQMSFSTEEAKEKCNEKSQEITQLQSELISIIEDINDKYERMKNFQ